MIERISRAYDCESTGRESHGKTLANRKATSTYLLTIASRRLQLRGWRMNSPDLKMRNPPSGAVPTDIYPKERECLIIKAEDRIRVTGAAGCIGSRVLQTLRERSSRK